MTKMKNKKKETELEHLFSATSGKKVLHQLWILLNSGQLLGYQFETQKYNWPNVTNRNCVDFTFSWLCTSLKLLNVNIKQCTSVTCWFLAICEKPT